MHHNMKKLLGLNIRPVFHAQSWPVPVDIKSAAIDENKSK